MVAKGLKIFIIVVLAGLFSLLLLEKIDLTTADLGRHIKNGEVILTGGLEQKRQVLTTNFYSYSQTEQPFVNHHWASGVVFFFLHNLFGFSGLSIFYLALSLSTFLLFFFFAKNQSSWFLAIALSLLLMPLMAFRTEVRPEVFTYFFSGVFYVVLWAWHKGSIGHKALLVLPLLQLFWVNLHIGFVFGLLLIGVFGIDQLIKLIRKRQNGFKPLLLVGFLAVIASSINPHFVKGLLYPFNIFREYGYNIVENQSVFNLHQLGANSNIPLALFYLALGVLLLSFLVLFIRNWKKASLVNSVIALVFVILAIFGIRHFTILAFFALPITAINLKESLSLKLHKAHEILFYILSALLIVASMFYVYLQLNQKPGFLSVGLAPEAKASLEFLKQNKIQGPIFNNYDVGGYLIYGGFPVFVDNRPEAYTVSFFKNIYIPMQHSQAKWEEVDRQYNFNVIFFSHRDFTPWAQNFLIARIQDNDWAPVFADDYNIIFLKKNTKNIGIIQEYYIPPENFQVVPF